MTKDIYYESVVKTYVFFSLRKISKFCTERPNECYFFKEVEFYSRPLLNRLHLLHILIPLLLRLFFLNSHLLLLPYVLVVVTEGIPDAEELLLLGIFHLALLRCQAEVLPSSHLDLLTFFNIWRLRHACLKVSLFMHHKHLYSISVSSCVSIA